MRARRIGVAALFGATLLAAASAAAQTPKPGGILRIYHRETPGGISIHEEATFSTNVPAMPIFNNLVVYDQHKEQNSDATIVPELATSWSWSADKTALTFKLREGVKWHDGVPFTSKDVKCTWDMLRGVSEQKFRKNPRKDWYANVSDITVNGDLEVTFHLESDRSPRCSTCSRRAIRRSIPATSRRRRCACIRSAPARSSSSR